MRNDSHRSAYPLRGLVLDHVAIAVASIDDALPAFEALTGHPGSPRERVDAQGIELCFVGEGDGKLELVEPLAADSPVGRFLAKRGPGIHHIAYRVSDIDAALRSAEGSGLEVIQPAPTAGAHGHRVAFIHPRSTGGVLVELVEP